MSGAYSQQVGPSGTGGGSGPGAGYADNKPAAPPGNHGNGDALRTEDEMTASTGELNT